METAADGRQAHKHEAAMKSGRPFDLSIMDLTIPGGMSGKEAISRLLAFDPAARVVVSTGYASDSVMAGYADYGFCDSLPKPFSLRGLGEVVSRVLGKA